MKPKSRLLKTAAVLAAAIYLAGATVPTLVPTVHALYWEDDYHGNDPKERLRRPTGFFLFNWIDSVIHKSNQKHYGKLENRDTGSRVNKGRRTTLVVTCGVVGLGTGVILGSAFTDDENNKTSNMFIGGALGLGVGVLMASVLMPRDYQVDPVALSESLKYRQAWLQDDSWRTVRAAFHPSASLIQTQF